MATDTKDPAGAARPSPEEETPRTRGSEIEPDPVVPIEKPPEELAGEETSVRAEVAGTSRYTSWEKLELRKKANKLKNKGVRYALPRNTLPGVVLRLRPLSHGALTAAQGDEEREVRRALGLRIRADMPQEGRIELNRRTVMLSLLEWCAGEADLEGARRAVLLKNAGVRFAFPNTSPFPGGVIRLRPLSHPYLVIVRVDRESELRERLGIRDRDELPSAASVELDRVMVEHSILSWESDDEMGRELGLHKMDAWELRRFFREHFFPEPDLSREVPGNEEERDDFYQELFDELDNDMLGEFLRAQNLIRLLTNDEILARGQETTVGSDWEYRGEAIYEPGEMTSLAGLHPRRLQEAFAEVFLPPVDLKKKVPSNQVVREQVYEEMFAGFSNEMLNELLEGHDMIRQTPPEEVLEKGEGFTVGALGGTGSNG